MRTKLATYALAGTLGLTGAAGAALLAPAVSYAATGDGTALSNRVASITSALSGLVSDGSLTQAQADEVAGVLAETPFGGHGGHGRGDGRGRGGRVDLAVAAEALGLTPEELRTQTRAGQTLADIAAEQNVEEADLVAALVEAEQTRLDEAVAAGALTQAEADERAAGLEARITDSLDELCGPGGGGGRGPRGGATAEAPAAPTSPEASASSGDA